jgi:hypothetical protein
VLEAAHRGAAVAALDRRQRGSIRRRRDDGRGERGEDERA